MLPINPEFGAAELGYVLNNSEPKLLFIESDLLEVVKVACNENELIPIITFLDQPQNSERHPQHQNIDEILSHSESLKSDL